MQVKVPLNSENQIVVDKEKNIIKIQKVKRPLLCERITMLLTKIKNLFTSRKRQIIVNLNLVRSKSTLQLKRIRDARKKKKFVTFKDLE